MNGRNLDPFGRPARSARGKWIAAVLTALIAGSVCPPRAGSATPPRDIRPPEQSEVIGAAIATSIAGLLRRSSYEGGMKKAFRFILRSARPRRNREILERQFFFVTRGPTSCARALRLKSAEYRIIVHLDLTPRVEPDRDDNFPGTGGDPYTTKSAHCVPPFRRSR